MGDLVTLAMTKKKLRIFHDDRDPHYAILITAASEAVINYLGAQADAVLDLDSGGDPVSILAVPAVVQAATLCLIDVMDRDGEAADQFAQGYLPKPVTSLLYPLRDPALA